jgi:hypothetical protein
MFVLFEWEDKGLRLIRVREPLKGIDDSMDFGGCQVCFNVIMKYGLLSLKILTEETLL